MSCRVPPPPAACFHLLNHTPMLYRMPQEDRSIFWEVIISDILEKSVLVHVSSSERFPVPKLLIRKRCYVLSSNTGIVEVTKLVQFT
jgi:hypothetical protein